MKTIPGIIFLTIIAAVFACSDNPADSGGVTEPAYQTIELRDNESTRIPFARTTLAIDSIVDTRCPINAYCIVPGEASVGFTLNSQEHHLLTLPPDIAWGNPIQASNFLLRDEIGYFFIGVSPYPGTEPPDSVDQKAHLTALSLRSTPSKVIPVLGNGRYYEIDDVVRIDSLRIDDNELSFDLQYGGGCERHSFALLMAPSTFSPRDTQARLYLVHYGRGDACRALVHQTLDFDLTPIRDIMMDTYGGLSDVTLILYQPHESIADTITYTPIPD